MKRTFNPRQFRLDTKRTNQLINYCDIMGYEFDDYTHNYPIIKKEKEQCFITVIGCTLYAVYVDSKNCNTPVYINLSDTIETMLQMLSLSNLDITEYKTRRLLYGQKLFNLLFGILMFENYDEQNTRVLSNSSITA